MIPLSTVNAFIWPELGPKTTTTIQLFVLTLLGFVFLSLVKAINLQWRRQKIIRDHGCQNPPGPSQLDPFFGLKTLIHALFSSYRQRPKNASFKDQFDKFGRTFQSRVYGMTKLFTIEPKNLQSIFSADFDSWGVQPLRLFYFGPFVGKGIMTTDAAFWAQSRALMKPTFARSQIADLSAYDIHVERLIELIPKDGSVIDLQPLFARLALDSSTAFLFGNSTASLTASPAVDAKAFLQAYNYGQAGIGKRMQLSQWNILTQDKRFWRSCVIAHEFVEKCVKEALNSKERRHEKGTDKLVLVHELAKQTDDLEDIRNQLLNVFMPAHDATSVALTNILFHLCRHPKVYARLRQEVVSGGEEALTFEGLKRLRYLQHVMSETFRLNPAIGQMNRISLRDTILPTGGGPNGTSPIFVKKGTIAVTSFYALHRLEHIYGTDAHIFRPERWETLRPPPWSYLPFGGGPRICIGQQLALTEVAYTLAKIVQRFPRIENADPVLEFVEQWKLTTDSKNGAKVRLYQ
ncbi:MAG: hypothetical protein Q9225_000746 [Loekoesia sp. 1 TL-2023]